MNEFIPIELAVSGIMHAQKKPEGSKPFRLKVRRRLVNALAAGAVGWEASSWFETYETAHGNTYDENGGFTSEMPRYGWPNAFWQPGLAAQDYLWENGRFEAEGEVTLLTAPNHKVKLWIEHSKCTSARWHRVALGVRVCLDDVAEQLFGPAFHEWRTPRILPEPRPLSNHWRAAYERLIAQALVDPTALGSELSQSIFDAFEGFERPHDDDISRLAARIRREVERLTDGQAEPEAPI